MEKEAHLQLTSLHQKAKINKKDYGVRYTD